MEKQGKIKIVLYKDEDNVTMSKCIVEQSQIKVAFIESYENTVLVKSQNVPDWLINKIRTNKVKHDDNVIVTVKDNGEVLIENEEAVIELPKLWSHSVDELFEVRHSKIEVRDMLLELASKLHSVYMSDTSAMRKVINKNETLTQMFNKYQLPND